MIRVVFYLLPFIIVLNGCCFKPFEKKENKFKRMVLCSRRVNNDNSLRVLKEGAFCCPKLDKNINDLTDARVFYLKKALEVDPQRVDGWESLGQTYWDDYRFKDAIISFKKAEELAPKKISILIALSSLYRIIKEFDNSYFYIEKIEKCDDPQKEMVMAYLKGKLFYEKGDYDSSLKELLKVKEMVEGEMPSHFLGNSPYNSNDLYFYLAQIYLKKNENQKAHEMFLKYLERERHPDFVETYKKALEETGGEQILLYDEIEKYWTRPRQ